MMLFDLIYNCYKYNNTQLKPGDIVFFQSLGIFNSKFVSSIISSSANKKPIYHVAMVTRSDINAVGLIDASPEYGVHIKEYANLCQTHGYFQDIEVTRVNIDPKYTQLAVKFALAQQGAEYNDLFLDDLINSRDNFAFYCSQLIQFAYKNAGIGDIFPDIKMSFLNAEGEISEYWQSYYYERSAVVPQGEPGSHPASLYDSEYLIHL